MIERADDAERRHLHRRHLLERDSLVVIAAQDAATEYWSKFLSARQRASAFWYSSSVGFRFGGAWRKSRLLLMQPASISAASFRMRGLFASSGERPAAAACVAVRKRSGCSVSSCATVAAAEREPDDVRAVDLQVVEQARHVERLLPAVLLRVVRLAAPAGAARVVGDDAEILREVGDHTGRDPGLQVGRPAVQQHDRLALAAIDVVDADAVSEVRVFAVLDSKRGHQREAKQHGGGADAGCHDLPLVMT